MATVNDDQRIRFLEPYARGEKQSAIAISEPGAGADPAGMTTRATRVGNGWTLNGRKIWISRAASADFTIVMAVTDKAKGARGGISAFVVEKGTKGFNVLRRIPMIGGAYTYELAIEDCHVPAENLLGQEGYGFAPMQLRLSTRRLQMAAWCIGISERALGMMCEYAPQRVTFGVPLSERQTIQWWIADAATRIHACRLMTYDAAVKVDRGQDPRTEVSMIKAFATEMAWDIVDHAMQTFGAMGMTKELPLQMMANRVRVMRIYEGPSEIHRWVVARNTLGHRG
jgi:alkylation response protein AidB-like acyl-CoA dehydrogenase